MPDQHIVVQRGTETIWPMLNQHRTSIASQFTLLCGVVVCAVLAEWPTYADEVTVVAPVPPATDVISAPSALPEDLPRYLMSID